LYVFFPFLFIATLAYPHLDCDFVIPSVVGLSGKHTMYNALACIFYPETVALLTSLHSQTRGTSTTVCKR
jgi:hypothetical protein